MRWQATRILVALLVSTVPVSAQTASAPGTAVIRGRVTIAETGRPLDHAVVVLNSTAGQSTARVNRSVTTDRDGRYEFASLPAQRYNMTATIAGYVSLPGNDGQEASATLRSPFDLTEGQVIANADFKLFSGGVITGRITDEFGDPVAGADVQAMRELYISGGNRQLTPLGSFPAQYRTNDRGEFRAFGLPPGRYLVAANASLIGYTMSPQGGLATIQSASSTEAPQGLAITYFPGTLSSRDAQRVILNAGKQVSASFALIPAKLSRITGVVQTSEGRPGAGFTVRLNYPAGSGPGSVVGMDQTGSDGSFALSSVPPGQYEVEVTRRTNFSGPNGPEPAANAPAEFLTKPLSVEGADLTDLVLTTTAGIAISGHVTFQGRRPPANVALQIVASSPEYSNTPGMASSESNTARVDPSDNFRIQGADGKVLFRQQSLPPPWAIKSVTFNGRDIIDIPLNLDEVNERQLNGLEIVVTDHQPRLTGYARSATGELITRYKVVLFPVNLPAAAVPHRFMYTSAPDGKGRFQIARLPPGDYVGVATSPFEPWFEWDPDFQKRVKPAAKPFTLKEDDDLTIELPFTE